MGPNQSNWSTLWRIRVSTNQIAGCAYLHIQYGAFGNMWCDMMWNEFVYAQVRKKTGSHINNVDLFKYIVLETILTFLFVSGVSVRKWHESVRVYDAFVEDESVAFGRCDDFEILGGWVSPEEIGVDDVYVAPFVERGELTRLGYFVAWRHSWFAAIFISDFAADFALVGFVTVIFGSSGGEFGDEVAVIQFVGHITYKVCRVDQVRWCRWRSLCRSIALFVGVVPRPRIVCVSRDRWW